MPKITFTPTAPDPAAEARHQRRSAYRQGAEKKILTAREQRLNRLIARGPAIDKATDAYLDLDLHGTTTRIRQSALYIETARPLPPRLGGKQREPGFDLTRARRAERGSRKPLGALAGHRGPALGTYLTMLYVLAADPGWLPRVKTATATYTNDKTWALLAGHDDGRPRARREVMARVLTALEAQNVIRRHTRGSGVSIDGFEFLSEDGSRAPYQVPGPTEAALALPGSFFTNGWHLVLDPAEIGMILTVMDATDRYVNSEWISHPEGVELTQHLRHERYGISSEVYHSFHTLSEFGLMDFFDPMIQVRDRGKFSPPTGADLTDETRSLALAPVPYRLRVLPAGFERDAQPVVKAALKESPPRMREGYTETLRFLAEVRADPVVAEPTKIGQ